MATTISGSTYLNGAVTLGRFDRAPGDADPELVVSPSPPGEPNMLFLDVRTLRGFARGGDDALTALPDFVTIVGDAQAIQSFAQGGDDRLSGMHFAGDVYGDAVSITGFGAGGDDLIDNFVRGGSTFGDAGAMSGSAQGGDDTITVGGRFVTAYGDAATLADRARGGDDVLRLSSADIGTLIGDGTLSGRARGGDDVLHAAPLGAGPATLYGDGPTLADFATGGDDVLIASAGADILWGDGQVAGPDVKTGRDRFVFDAGGGTDTVMDFVHNRDVIDLRPMADDGIRGIADLAFATARAPQGYDVTITTGVGMEILVHSDAVLTWRDFLFG